MDKQNPPQKKQPFLRDVEETSTPSETVRVTAGKQTTELVLHDNDFLQPQGNPWMWGGFLIVPLIVLLFAYAQGLLFSDRGGAVE